jgi:hypothetical protein
VVKAIARLWRSFKWFMHSLWLGYPAPRVEKKLRSRSYMRKVWRERLRAMDRFVNLTDSEQDKRFLLINRRLMVAKRRLYRLE